MTINEIDGLRGPQVLVVALAASVLAAAGSRGEAAVWSEPAIDTWAYVNGFGGGGRLLAPSFGSNFLDDDTQLLEPGSASAPSRLGSMLIAFETSGLVTPSLDPKRYAVTAATVTARVQSGSSGMLPFEADPSTPASLLAEATGAGVSSRKAFELFGVGFRAGYEGFALGPTAAGTRFTESTPVHSGPGGSYVAYPIVGDGAGGYTDVANHLGGGFSATASGGITAPFGVTPWGVGDAALAPGDAIPNDTTFAFDLDLTLPGVLEYLQRSLSEGAVGFFLSSVHPAAQPGFPGGGSYPQWYAKEALGVFPNAEAATLTLDVTVLPKPGDYDGNGVVQQADYATWGSAYGTAPPAPGLGSDGNGDGRVDAADYTVWRDAQAASPSAIAIPEPGAATLALGGVLLVNFVTGTVAVANPRGRR